MACVLGVAKGERPFCKVTVFLLCQPTTLRVQVYVMNQISGPLPHWWWGSVKTYNAWYAYFTTGYIHHLQGSPKLCPFYVNKAVFGPPGIQPDFDNKRLTNLQDCLNHAVLIPQIEYMKRLNVYTHAYVLKSTSCQLIHWQLKESDKTSSSPGVILIIWHRSVLSVQLIDLKVMKV